MSEYLRKSFIEAIEKFEKSLQDAGYETEKRIMRFDLEAKIRVKGDGSRKSSYIEIVHRTV